MWRVVLCLLVFTCSGCGMIIHGRQQSIRITTTPPEAHVKIPDLMQGVPTPTRITLPRNQSYLIEITKPEGYGHRWVVVERHISSGVFLADIFLTGGLGLLIDGFTGAWYTLSPSVIEVTLDPLGDNGLPASVRLWLADGTVYCTDPSVRLAVYPISNTYETSSGRKAIRPMNVEKTSKR